MAVQAAIEHLQRPAGDNDRPGRTHIGAFAEAQQVADGTGFRLCHLRPQAKHP
jgi:hypothetical protein